MSNYKISPPTIVTVNGNECRIFTQYTPYGTNASGIAFDDEVNVIADVDSIRYMDWCHACIVALTVARMMPDLDNRAIWEDMADSGHNCTCG